MPRDMKGALPWTTSWGRLSPLPLALSVSETADTSATDATVTHPSLGGPTDGHVYVKRKMGLVAVAGVTEVNMEVLRVGLLTGTAVALLLVLVLIGGGVRASGGGVLAPRGAPAHLLFGQGVVAQV